MQSPKYNFLLINNNRDLNLSRRKQNELFMDVNSNYGGVYVSNETFMQHPLALDCMEKNELYLTQKRQLKIEIYEPVPAFKIYQKDAVANYYLSFNDYLTPEFNKNIQQPIIDSYTFFGFLKMNKIEKVNDNQNNTTFLNSEEVRINYAENHKTIKIDKLFINPFQNFKKEIDLSNFVRDDFLFNLTKLIDNFEKRSSIFKKNYFAIINIDWVTRISSDNNRLININDKVFINIYGEECKIENAFWQGNPYYQLKYEKFANWLNSLLKNLTGEQQINLLKSLIDDYQYIKESVSISLKNNKISNEIIKEINDKYFDDAVKTYFENELIRLNKIKTAKIRSQKLKKVTLPTNSLSNQDKEQILKKIGKYQGKKFKFETKMKIQNIVKIIISEMSKNAYWGITFNKKNYIENKVKVIELILSLFDFNGSTVKMYVGEYRNGDVKDVIDKVTQEDFELMSKGIQILLEKKV